MAEYYGQGLAHLDVHPKRAGYLVPSRGVRSFVQAVERACSRWGGITEPISGVSPGGRVPVAWRQVFDVAAPDVIFSVGEMTDEARRRVHADVGVSPLDVRHENRPQYGVHALAPYGDADSRRLVQCDGRRALDWVGAGRLASWDSESMWRAQGVEVQTASSRAELAMAQLRGVTVIEATGRHISTLSAGNLFAPPVVLWITTGSSKDLFWFWNMRALALRGFGYSGFALVGLETAQDGEFQSLLLEWLYGRHRLTTPDVIVKSFSVPVGRLRKIVSLLGLQKARKASMHFGEGATGPLTAAVQVELRRFVFADRMAGARASALVAVERPKTTVRMPSPVQFADIGGHVKVRLSGLDFLAVPRTPETAQLLHRDAVWRHDQLELETNLDSLYQFELNVPLGTEVLTAAVASCGARYTLSQPGRLADAVLGLVDQATIFADENCHRLIGALTTPRSRSLVRQLVAQLPQGTEAQLIETVARSVGSVRQVDLPLQAIANKANLQAEFAAPLLDRLVRAGLVIRGLRTECDRCGLKLFVPLHESSRGAPCSGCGAAARYATGPTHEPQLHYRLNALVDRASDQGVLCHLYAHARLLQRDASQSYVVLGANVAWADGTTAEVDLLGYLDGKLLAGEAKMTAEWFVPDQVARDVRVSKAVGASVHVMACLQPVPPLVTARAEQLASELGMTFWLLAPE